jgi:hypothetical protein
VPAKTAGRLVSDGVYLSSNITIVVTESVIEWINNRRTISPVHFNGDNSSVIYCANSVANICEQREINSSMPLGNLGSGSTVDNLDAGVIFTFTSIIKSLDSIECNATCRVAEDNVS